MDEDFDMVIPASVWVLHVFTDEDGALCCDRCKESILGVVDWSIMHLLWNVKRHLKEKHNG